MTAGKPMKIILDFTIPVFIGNVFQQFYNMVDAIIVGKFVGTKALAAVGSTGTIMFLILGFLTGLTAGFTVLTAQKFGAGKMDEMRQTVGNAAILSVIVSVVMTAVSMIGMHSLLKLMNTPSDIFKDAYAYIMIICGGIFAQVLYNILASILRALGNSKTPLYFLILAALLNIVLDLVFIIVFHMGAAGAAIATVTGQIVSFFILLRLSYTQQNIGIYWKNFRPSWKAFKEIFYGGSPSLSRQGLGCLSTIALNLSAGQFGDAAIAAMTIVNRLTMLVMSAVVGLGQGFQPLCGFCYGARLYSRLRRAYWFTVKVGTLFLLICAIFGVIFSQEIVSCFRDDAAVISIGGFTLCCQLLAYPLNAFSMTSNMLTQTCRKPWRANLLASSRRGLFFIPIVILLPQFWGLFGVEISQCVSDILGFLLTIPIMIYTFKELKE